MTSGQRQRGGPVRWRRSLRRGLRVSGTALAGALACVMIAVGGIDGAHLWSAGAGTATYVATLGLAMISAVVGIVCVRRIQFVAPAARAQRASFWLSSAVDLADIGVALALVAGTFAVITVSGPGGTGAASGDPGASVAYPLLYGVVAFSVTIMTRSGAITAIGAAVLLELAALGRTFEHVGRHGPTRALILAAVLHLVFILGAATAHAALLRGMVARYRRRRADRLDEELAQVRQGARDFRLIASSLGAASRGARSRDEEERLLAIGGVEIIGESCAWVLGQLKKSLGAQTVALVWVDDDGERIKLKEIITDCDDIAEGRWLPKAGVLGAVLRDRAPLLINATRSGQLPYYTTGRAELAFAAVPLVDGSHLRAILCADRAMPFGDTERDELISGAAQVLRAVHGEQVFRAVERAKYEHERFYAATALLGHALTPEQVMETAFDAAAAIGEFDVAVVTLFDKATSRHRVAAHRIRPGVTGMLDVEALRDLEYKDNAGLAAMVVKNRHYLPAGGEVRDGSVPVFTKKVTIENAKSLIVLPLLAADEPLGTLTLAAQGEKRFAKDVREMLLVIATQVAVSLQNGFLYKKMETMATTDGLTGLTNHRSFQDRFAEMLARASRHNHRVAVLLCDIDFFKKVNDGYGHPVGDEVLRRVAKVLQDVPRKIDIAARYGGEEFAVLLDNVDLEQARAVAERIRTEIAKVVVETEKGPLSVTESIGVACFPDDGRDRATLIERADLALYHAKHTGRNRVVTWQEFSATRSSTKLSVVPKAS